VSDSIRILATPLIIDGLPDMNLLIVSATEQELTPLLEEYASNVNGSMIELDGLTVEVLVTGVGMTSTAFSLGSRFADKDKSVDLAINAGIAGSFRPDLEVGAVVNVTQDCLADFGAEDDDSFITADELGLVKQDELVFDNPQLYQNTLIEKLPTAKAITTNTAHGSEQSIERVTTIYHPDIESMEGAAFASACSKAEIPYYQIRAISNLVERRNTDNWNIPLAVKSLNDTLIALVVTLLRQS